MKIQKKPLVSDRLRRPPKSGWSWIDRQFLREHAPALERDAILLYFFLTAVSDRNGLSYYSDTAVEGRIRLQESQVSRARDSLLRRDLIAYRDPLYQVLSMPRPLHERHGGAAPQLLGDILKEVARRSESRRRS